MLAFAGVTESEARARAAKSGHRVVGAYPDTRGQQAPARALTEHEMRRAVSSGIANGIVKFILFALFFVVTIAFALRSCAG